MGEQGQVSSVCECVRRCEGAWEGVCVHERGAGVRLGAHVRVCVRACLRVYWGQERGCACVLTSKSVCV